MSCDHHRPTLQDELPIAKLPPLSGIERATLEIVAEVLFQAVDLHMAHDRAVRDNDFSDRERILLYAASLEKTRAAHRIAKRLLNR